MKKNSTTELRSMRSYDKIYENDFGSRFYTEINKSVMELHHHDYYEIVCYLDDMPLKYYYEGKYYFLQRGDIVLCDMFQEHKFCTDKKGAYSRISIGISPSMMVKLSHEKSNLFQIFNPRQPNYPVYHPDFVKGIKYMNLIQSYIELEKSKDCFVIRQALVHLLLAYLYRDCCREVDDGYKGFLHKQLVSEILQYMDAHFTEGITLEQIAERVNYSPGYISRIFKEVTGDKVNQYLLKKKIGYAKELIEQKVSIIAAAAQSGFDNYSYFYRAFKKVNGIGPREYLELYKKQE